MEINRKAFFSILVVIFLFSGCSSMTPRYRLSDELPDLAEDNSALLQIPSGIHFYSFDGKETTFAVKYSLASQATVYHVFRETLIPEGLHYIIYRDPRRVGGEIVGSMQYIYSQKGFYVTAIEFKKGHTYRLQCHIQTEDGECAYYGWVEELPFLMKRREIKVGLDFDQQFEYWHNQDWRIAGVGLDTERFKDVDDGMKMFIATIESISQIDALKTKLPYLK